MKVMLSEDDLSTLRPETIADIWSLIGRRAPTGQDPPEEKDFSWDTAADLSINQINHFMETVSDGVQAGLEYFAKHGPIVLAEDLLQYSGISTLKDFQAATTKRTRTVTKVENATLLGWDNWNDDGKYPDGVGKYGVTPVTFDSLRRYFGLK